MNRKGLIYCKSNQPTNQLITLGVMVNELGEETIVCEFDSQCVSIIYVILFK